MGINLSELTNKRANADDAWGVYDWGKPSLAVVACDENGEGCILWFCGAHLDFEINEGGMKTLGDLGLDDAPPGISVWEGSYVGTKSETMDGTEYDTEVMGEFRSPTPQEWTEISLNTCPWDSDNWIREDLPDWARCKICGCLDMEAVSGIDCNCWKCVDCGHVEPETVSARLEE
jgi:hypothetical protein